MATRFTLDPTRRALLGGSLSFAASLALGCSGSPRQSAGSGGGGAGGGGGVADGGTDMDCGAPDPFAGGTLLGTLPFANDGDPVLNTPTGVGYGGREFYDLSALDEQDLVTPNADFYTRTRVPDLLPPTTDWSIAMGGLVAQAKTVPLASLMSLVEPMGTIVLECSGNGAGANFGLLSAAEWSGIPLMKALAMVTMMPSATAVLAYGFDTFDDPPYSQTPGCAWVYTFEQIQTFGAFLATHMNGVPLPIDHGFPVRVLVPGWYGCSCPKWLLGLDFVDDTEPATTQMMLYASRTMQNGTPALAKDYLAASMDQAAMPVRIEKWSVGGVIRYRVVGILWGGYAVTDKLVIHFNTGDPYFPVTVCPPQTTNRTWTLWTYAWTPPAPGDYAITLKVDDPTVPQRRLAEGFYLRTVTIDEV
jgi:DMSO/TMAO reductase YedYZ molybdopterin-dependent catalytic subunit